MSKIEWTQKTWNPIVSGCSIISSGCQNCYAMNMAHRLSSMEATAGKYKGTTKRTEKGRTIWTSKILITKDDPTLFEPLKRKKPTMYFVNSMTDLFHQDVPFKVVDKIMAVIALTPQHTYQLLTKRPERMREYFKHLENSPESIDEIGHEFYLQHMNQKMNNEAPKNWWFSTSKDENGLKDYEFFYEGYKYNALSQTYDYFFPNLWLGVSVEDQKTANQRIPHLLSTPSIIHFISAEPLIDAVDFTSIEATAKQLFEGAEELSMNFNSLGADHSDFDFAIDWVIVGGESGHKARPMNPTWVRDIRDACKDNGVAFFFKQWGTWNPYEETAQPPFYYNSPNNKQIDGHYLDFSGDGFGDDWLEPEYDGCAFLKAKEKIVNALDGIKYLEYPKLENHEQ